MGFTVRAERDADGPAIRRVHDAAFGGREEGLLVDELRRSHSLLLSLVAVVRGEIVGHIAFSRITVSDGAPSEAVSLAPLGVVPAQQRTGVGTALTNAGMEQLKQDGEALVFVLGDPNYYGRFGFSADAAEPYTSPWPGDAFQACWLRPVLPQSGGILHYPEAFQSPDP